ncbi:MAG: FUSC family protein, partial [Pseudonocardia sp.]|nr:FUSC family protein [Pseudonocardia sp.]
MRSSSGPRLAVTDWLGEMVPDWLADVMRPKKAPVPWADMTRAVFAIWVPLAAGFITGRKEIALLPAMGGLLSVMIDQGGPFPVRVRRIGTAAIFGGAAGLTVGSLIHGRGWIAVGALVVVAGVSAILARLGGVGSVTGLQLLIYSSLGLGPLGALRPWWHTALEFIAGAVWALALSLPGWLLSPRAAEQRAVAAVYHTLASDLRAIGTPGIVAARRQVTAALNAAYDALLTRRSTASGRNQPGMRLMAILNVSHQMAEAGAALRVSGERPPRWVTDTIDRLADAVLALPAWKRKSKAPLPLIPPPWSTSPGALALRDSMVSLARSISGNWSPSPAPAARAAGFRARLHDRAARLLEQLIGGRIAWEFTIRVMICTGVAAVASEVLPLQRSYWVVLTVAIVLKPDYGSVFARAVQRGAGTVLGAAGGAVILAVVPFGPWLLVPFGVLAALLPYGKSRNFGLAATFLTPFVVLLIDLLSPGGWRLAGERAVDTLLACAIVLLIG